MGTVLTIAILIIIIMEIYKRVAGYREQLTSWVMGNSNRMNKSAWEKMRKK